MGATLILTHDLADFDAVGSLLAASLLYAGSVPVLPRRAYGNVRAFLKRHGGELPFVLPGEQPRRGVERVVVVDAQSWAPLRGVTEGVEVEIIDHHPLVRELREGMRFRGEAVGAVTTLLAEELERREVRLTATQATLLLLGIYEDTGQLSFPSTTPRDVRATAWLLEQGASLEEASRFLRPPLSPGQQALFERLAAAAEILTFAAQPVVIASARAEAFEEEIASLAHRVADLYEPAACFLLVRTDGSIQLVARSYSPQVDVGRLAAHLGGGGHAHAAAAFVRDTGLEELRAELVRLLERQIRPAVKVREIMSYGVQTLHPGTRLEEAEEAARRYGHEGFPVVEAGQVVGVLTRGEIDKAMHHGLGKARVVEYMRRGAIAATPETPVEELQALMQEHDVGQVPVVEGGSIVGIVTRTDLIKLWAGGEAANLAGKMEAALPPAMLELLHRARDLAAQWDYHLYLVGGMVRDLILGLPNLDLDLVVEGDAIRLARGLARERGGRVISHGRFGTAKWQLPAKLASQEGIPATLDLVTARREVYEHPTALPEVEWSSIKQDLYRRDFTVNAMAVALDRDRYGQLLDFYGGLRDLRRGLIRVLHTLSLVEDPTRALRAVRLAQRLGFSIEAQTLALMRASLDLIPRVSGERLRDELELTFSERDPAAILKGMAEHGLLEALQAGLDASPELLERVRRLPTAWQEWRGEGAAGERPPAVAYLATLALGLGEEGARRLAQRLALSRRDREVVVGAARLWSRLGQICEPELAASRIFSLLQPHPELALLVAWAAARGPAADHLLHYQRRLRHVEAELGGHDLAALGLPRGPLYGQILEALRRARLDGEVSTREEELAWVQKRFLGHGR